VLTGRWGPMKLTPAAWLVVGVDADGDGKRDPQDIDDSALAAAVVLCSGAEDLAAPPGQRHALMRLAATREIVEAVMTLADDIETLG